jgi:hypothetical protein
MPSHAVCPEPVLGDRPAGSAPTPSDPIATVSVWDSLKTAIVRLLDEQPRALTSYPDPRVDRDRRPPFSIGLAAWATDAALELHDRFGSNVTLTIGALPYPPNNDRQVPGRGALDAPTVDPTRIGVDPSEPLSVRTGHTHRQELLLTNRTESLVAISSNGQLTAVVVDPVSHRAVGGFAGAQTLARVSFGVVPGATRAIPLLVGTASFDPALGYAVPAGEWAVQAPITINGDRMTTPILPLTVTD